MTIKGVLIKVVVRWGKVKSGEWR